jgi:hypothetical protein
MSSTGYGTAAAPAQSRNGSAGDEEQPLLRKPASGNYVGRAKKVLMHEVSRDWADIVLLLCYVTTGLLDSSSTNAWGAFVSMQTGRLATVPSTARACFG